MHRLRRRDRGVGIAHESCSYCTALEHEIGLHAEERRPPQHDVRELSDGWTVKTADGKLSAHYENTVALTDEGAIILTDAHV